jgi:transcription-repair coupling factor (superfamily II helicase)
MAVIPSDAGTADALLALAERLEHYEGFAEVVASLKSGQAATIDGAWGSACALVAAALARQAPGPVLVVCPHLDDVDDRLDDLRLFSPLSPETFPADGANSHADETAGERLRVMKQLQGSAAPKVLVASIQSLLEPVPDCESLAQQTRSIQVGEEIDIRQLSRWLVDNGFESTTAVELPGEFSVRGGIVDIFAPDWYNPVRVEFFGDQIESLRAFEVATQRSLASLDAVELTMLRPGDVHRGHLASYLPPDSWVLLVEPSELAEEGSHYLERLEKPEQYHTVQGVMESLVRFPSVTISAIAAGSLETTCRLAIESVERFSGDIGRVREELDTAGAGQEVFLVCQTEAEVNRLREVFGSTQLAQAGRLHFPLGRLPAGFRLVPNQIVLVSSNELFHRTDLQRRTVHRRLSRAIDSFLDLREGDLVVHIAHGIARYRGLKLLEKENQVEEHLVLEFHGGTKLYVPSSKIGLVQKYVGATKSRPVLARLGGHLWSRQKEKVQEAVSDLAVDMLELQAARQSKPGIAFPTDTDWQREFDASFPYQETEDQLITIEAIKHDMLQSRPMDRLLCGDVGFGKTEVAMRAAFKAVDAGYQVAVLVPTTILAEQHLRTFTARMAEFPFQIAALSRFASRKQQTDILAGLTDGSIDIVVGTHRLAQADVQFQNLGLVIIDEEQRFGVEVKERLKALRHIIDVLTMTATPIPRTLHLSLLGLRDISNLETPPADRLAVETRVARFDQQIIRHATLRELNRGGQIFFVHNRVNDIEILATRLRQIVPEATLRIAHGQMAENDLEQVMIDFIDHRFDMLLTTTIIESGLDIPNANTIFIDEADRYGLADLHQLRGRVGRYKHRAYCYLLIDPNKSLTPTAARRLHAIEEFSDMGAGFAIAMRDLEIRGAGNILGTEQSGHIAVVGYELYCQLLEETVRKLKSLPPRTTVEVELDLPGQGYVPRGYVPDMRMKIDLYRRLGRVATSVELADFRTELIDRFGQPPPPMEHLLALAGLRIAAHQWQIHSIHLEDHYAVLLYPPGAPVPELAQRSKGRLRVVDAISAYLPLDKDLTSPDAILTQLKALLQSS